MNKSSLFILSAFSLMAGLLANADPSRVQQYVVSSVTGGPYCISHELSSQVFGQVGDILDVSIGPDGVRFAQDGSSVVSDEFLTGTHTQSLLGAGDLVMVGKYTSANTFEQQVTGGSGSDYSISITRTETELTFDSTVPNPAGDVHCVLTPLEEHS
jgi:hypothetical protein